MENKIKGFYVDEYVSFKTAKLISKLGYVGQSVYGYTSDGKIEKPYYGSYYSNNDLDNSVIYEAPTKFAASKWIYKNFNVELNAFHSEEEEEKFYNEMEKISNLNNKQV